jgi:hypothetical protein
MLVHLGVGCLALRGQVTDPGDPFGEFLVRAWRQLLAPSVADSGWFAGAQGPDTPPIDSLLRRWLHDNHPDLAWVADVVDRANRELADRNTAIGPSHFLRPRLTEKLVRLAWENSVLPFLEEHFFDDPDQVRRFDLDRLRQGTPEPSASPKLRLIL